MANSVVIVFFVVVQPHFGQTDRVLSENIHSTSPFVRRAFPEYMAHMRAWNNLQSSSTHPSLEMKPIMYISTIDTHPSRTITNSYFERELQILSAPDVKTRIISSQSLKEIFVDRKKTTGHCGCGHSFGSAIVFLPFTFRNSVPIELQLTITYYSLSFDKYDQIETSHKSMSDIFDIDWFHFRIQLFAGRETPPSSRITRGCSWHLLPTDFID